MRNLNELELMKWDMVTVHFWEPQLKKADK